MPFGTTRGTVSGGADGSWLASAEAEGSRESRVAVGGASWALACPAKAYTKKREQTLCERAIIGAPLQLYHQADAAPETSVALGPGATATIEPSSVSSSNYATAACTHLCVAGESGWTMRIAGPLPAPQYASGGRCRNRYAWIWARRACAHDPQRSLKRSADRNSNSFQVLFPS